MKHAAHMAGCLLLSLFGLVRLDGAFAAVGLSFAVEEIEGEGWLIEGVRVSSASAAPGDLNLSIAVASIQLPDAQGTVDRLSLNCVAAWTDSDGWRCDEGQWRTESSPWGPQEFAWSGYWRPDGSLSIQLDGVRIADGAVAMSLSYGSEGWSMTASAHRLAIADLSTLIAVDMPPADWGVLGRLNGNVELSGRSGPARLRTQWVVDQLGFASPDGTQAAEEVVLRVDANAVRRSNSWQFDSVLRWPVGGVYSEPFFVDATATPLTLSLDGVWSPDKALLEIDTGLLSLAGAFDISGTGSVDTGKGTVRTVTLAAHAGDAGQLYDLVLQPAVIGTAADDMTLSGAVGVVLHVDKSGPQQAGLTLNGLTLDDRKGRFALSRTDGSVAWQREDQRSLSSITTQGASLLGIRSGPFTAEALFSGDSIVLSQPIVVPVLGGQVALDRFELDGALVAGDRPRWSADASVQGVSLQRLTESLDWPPFSGELSGVLADTRYQDGVFSVGGGLKVNAFQGDIVVEDLTIRDPLGAVPRLTAQATLRGLDLHELTQTFSFGRIEGRLDGDLSDLQLVAWEPDRFDLHLYTPPNDPTRRRISQRAVENLTELGSGIPGGLSASLLGIFEEFNYRSIDVKIGLQGDAAEIDGLAREEGGYYLVRGSGLPRIDVIGRNRRVAWKDLVERLRQIQVEGAKIE